MNNFVALKIINPNVKINQDLFYSKKFSNKSLYRNLVNLLNFKSRLKSYKIILVILLAQKLVKKRLIKSNRIKVNKNRNVQIKLNSLIF